MGLRDHLILTNKEVKIQKGSLTNQCDILIVLIVGTKAHSKQFFPHLPTSDTETCKNHQKLFVLLFKKLSRKEIQYNV